MRNRFCPDCGAEYRPGFERCSDCGVALTDEKPAPRPAEEPLAPTPVVEVASFGRGTDAEMARGYLEANGIDAYVQALGLSHWRLESALTEVTGLPSAFNSYRVMVFEQDALEAARLLDEANEADAAAPDNREVYPGRGLLSRLGTRWLVVAILGSVLLMYALALAGGLARAMQFLRNMAGIS